MKKTNHGKILLCALFRILGTISAVKPLREMYLNSDC